MHRSLLQGLVNLLFVKISVTAGDFTDVVNILSFGFFKEKTECTIRQNIEKFHCNSRQQKLLFFNCS